jgi:hypothetical protein
LCLSFTLVTSRTALAGTDFVDWGVLGPPNTTVANPFTVKSAGGVSVGVSAPLKISNYQTMEEAPVSDGATAILQENFAAGDHLVWLGTAKQLQLKRSNPMTLDFGAMTVQGGGAQIASAVYGNFVAKLEAFNASGVSLASFTEAGNAQNTNGDNSAIFIGIRSDTANISKITVSIVSAPLDTTAQFVINRFDFKTAGVASATQPDAATQARLGAAYGQLPSSVEANQGQTEAQVVDPARGHGGGIFALGITAETTNSNFNDPVGGRIFDDGSTIHLKKPVVDGIHYVARYYP